MGLNLGHALGRGTRRTLSVSGLGLFVAIVVYQFVFVGVLNTVILNSLPDGIPASEVGAIGFGLPVSTPVAAVIGAISVLFGTGVFLVATRLLARDLSALGSVPISLLGHRFGWAFLSTLAVSLLLVIVIPLGFAFLVLPGLFLAVSFQFAIFAIGVEDLGPLAALRRSWALATGNRWRLCGLLLLVAVLGGISNAIGTVVSLADPAAGQIVSLLLNSVVVILMYGILADAFVQLSGSSMTDTSETSTTAI